MCSEDSPIEPQPVTEEYIRAHTVRGIIDYLADQLPTEQCGSGHEHEPELLLDRKGLASFILSGIAMGVIIGGQNEYDREQLEQAITYDWAEEQAPIVRRILRTVHVGEC